MPFASSASRLIWNRPAPLAALPGSDGVAELFHLVRDPEAFLAQRFARYGRLWKSRLIVPVVFAVGEEANRTILIHRAADFSEGLGYARTPVRWVFAGSIMLQDGEQHLRTRAVLTPAVGRLALHESAKQVHAIWERRSAALQPERAEDVYQLAEQTTFEVAANVLVGLALGPAVDRFRPLFEDVIGGMMVHLPIRVPRGKLDRSLKARLALIEQLAPHVLRARASDPVGLVGQLAHYRDEDGRWLSAEEVVGHLVMLAWAGYDTTASAASWILHLLAQRPDWQEKIRDELASIGDDPGQLESATQAPLLESFLLEVERLHPSALFFPRVCRTDQELLGHLIPQGTLVFYSPYLSHRDPVVFENPNAFDPDRWTAARGEKRLSPARLFGFGGGIRVCLGKPFAKLQLRLLSRAILRRHRIEPDPLARPRIQGLPVHHPVGSRVRFVPC